MNEKLTVLWISPYAPYDHVAHGGGKTHNFYIKYMHKSGKYEITLLSICLKDEAAKLDLDAYGISNHISVLDENLLTLIQRIVVSGFAFRNPFDRYGGLCLPYERKQIKTALADYCKRNKNPKLIILQWTFSLLFIDQIKQLFPDSYVVAIEEDVSFLNYMRKAKSADRFYQKYFWNKRYQIAKKTELQKLQLSDLVVTNNPKDTDLLEKCGIPSQSIFTSVPFVESFSYVERKKTTKNIIFLGAMSRPENYLSAIWFIKNVFHRLTDTEIRFVIVGGKPHASLRKYECDRIVITGFVENIAQYFETCLCMAAPLVGGAGIKIKVLEAMSAGVPVLTNEIGIEGIPATDKIEYFYCKSADDYVETIEELLQNKRLMNEVSNQSKRFIQNNYDLSIKINELLDRIAVKVV